MDPTARLQTAVHRFAEKPDETRALFYELAERAPQELRTAALTCIRQNAESDAARFLLRALHDRGMLADMLVNPAAMPMQDAVRIAALAQSCIKRFDVDLTMTIEHRSEVQSLRAAELISRLTLSRDALAALADALRHKEPKVRSLVARICAGVSNDPTQINYLVNDSDPRVRANAIEALHGDRGLRTVALFRDALADNHHRVAANAALGLCRLGDSDGAAHLERMIRHDDRKHRISAAWAMGETGDKRFLPHLLQLDSDSIASVRSAALAATRTLRGETPKLVVRSWFESDGSRRVVRAVVRDSAGEPLLDLDQDAFWLVDGGEQIVSFELIGPHQRKPIAVSYVLDARAKLDGEGLASINAALVASLETKREDDVFRAYRYSDLIESAVGFGGDLERLRYALDRPHNGGGRALRVFDAVSEALGTIERESGRERHIVVLSSGVDRGSKVRLDQLTRSARDAGVTIHAVALGVDADRRALKLLASKTSGLFQSVKTPPDLNAAFSRVFSALASCFQITYERAAAPMSEITLTVKCDRGEGVGRCVDPSAVASPAAARPKAALRPLRRA